MSKISVTTIAGLTSGGDANTVKIESGDDFVVDTNVLKVDSSNNRVGIGTASPSQDLTIVNSGSARMELISGTSGTSIIDMGDSADSDIGGIRYLQSSDRLQFRAGNDVRVSIDSNGLKFGSDTAAANALDDYEEGTWTATLGGLSSNPTVSAYSYNSGHYTKIGRQVFAHIYMRIESGNISGGSGDATILGLPFTSKSSGSISNGAGAWIENYTYTSTSFSSGRSYARPFMVAGENRMRINQLSYSNPQQATGWSLTQADDAALMFGGVMVYMTD